MTQVSKGRAPHTRNHPRNRAKASGPLSPAQAAACCRPVDDLLDPELFKALCDPTRIGLLACLLKCARPCAVTEIAACCKVDLSVVSRHLQMLARAGILDAARDGRTVFYSVRARQLCATLRALADAVEECCPQTSCVPSKAPTLRPAAR